MGLPLLSETRTTAQAERPAIVLSLPCAQETEECSSELRSCHPLSETRPGTQFKRHIPNDKHSALSIQFPKNSVVSYPLTSVPDWPEDQCVCRLRWESHLPLRGAHLLPRPVEDSVKPSAGTAIRSPFMTAVTAHEAPSPAPQFQFPLKGNGGSMIYLPRNLSEGEYLGVESTIY